MSQSDHRPSEPLAAIAALTVDNIDQRLTQLDAERAALATLRRALAARDRVRRRCQVQEQVKGGAA